MIRDTGRGGEHRCASRRSRTRCPVPRTRPRGLWRSSPRPTGPALSPPRRAGRPGPGPAGPHCWSAGHRPRPSTHRPPAPRPQPRTRCGGGGCAARYGCTAPCPCPARRPPHPWFPINRRDLQQGGTTHRPHQGQHPGVDLPDRGLNTPQVRGGETARDPGRSRRRRGRHRFQQLSGHIRTPPVQTDQEITTGQLARGHRHHQATPRQAPATLLDLSHARVQRAVIPRTRSSSRTASTPAHPVNRASGAPTRTRRARTRRFRPRSPSRKVATEQMPFPLDPSVLDKPHRSKAKGICASRPADHYSRIRV